MSVSQINPNSLFPKNYRVNQNTMPTAEEASAFEASLEAASEGASANNQDPSQEKNDASVPAASWDAVRAGFTHSLFDHDRREFAYYDRVRREIDYDNKS